MTPDPHTLVGAYVLDALPPDERDLFEVHTERCPDCRAEAAELLDAAARLGRATAIVPSPSLRAPVLSEAARTRQVAPGGPIAAPRDVRRTWPLALASAAMIAVVVALGALVLQADHRADRAERVVAVVSSPDAQAVALAEGESGTMRLVVSEDHGRSVVVADDMAPPPTGKAYALWFEKEGQMVPAGLFTPDSDGSVRLEVDDVPVDEVGVTVEDAGGADEPTLPTIASGSL